MKQMQVIINLFNLKPGEMCIRDRCEWDAKDSTVLKNLLEAMKNAFPNFPIDGPYPMKKVDGESYR